MLPTEFKGQNVVYAKDQKEYLPLPAFKVPNSDYGQVFFCWRLSYWERIKLLFTGKVWHQVLTFNDRLQPQLLDVDRPDIIPKV
jgi:hypothetical protein